MICGLERDGDRLRVLCPGVGMWRGGPLAGQVVVGGQDIGALEVLGRLHRLRLPEGAAGRIVEVGGGAVDFGATLVVLDPQVASAEVAGAAPVEARAAALVFRAPSSGRFYSRPAPDRPPFVSAGDVVTAGQTVCMVEVMKTFSRIGYGGAHLPERARIVRVVPEDESDLESGDAILELEAIS